MKLLDDLTIIDFTSRLPGPLASWTLANHGAKVIKIESLERADSFTENEANQVSPTFNDWYKNLNQNKEIVRIDFKQDQEYLKALVEDSDAIIIPDQNFFNKLLLSWKTKVVIKIAGGTGEWKSLHDLNALALTKTFALHLNQSKKPPYLPFAGINFGLNIALTLSHAIIKNIKTKTQVEKILYLKDVTQEIFDLFDSSSFIQKPTQLHNGALPSYNIYQTQDQKFLCLAAVEEKFWAEFCETFQFSLKLQDRYDNSGKTYEIIQNKFATLKHNEIRNIIANKDICLTLVD